MKHFNIKLPPLKITFKNEKWDLLFRPIDVTDLKIIHESTRQTDESLKRFMPWAHYEMNAEEHAKLFMRFHAEYYLGVEYHLICIDSKTNDFVLNFGILPQQRFNRHSVEIGYWTASHYQNLGLTTLAAKIIIATCFEALECDRIFATTNIENTPSIRVLEKCGMKKEGVLKNALDAPSEKMITNGFSTERSSYLFALIPEDRSSLSWYQDILLSTTAVSVFGSKMSLKELTLQES